MESQISSRIKVLAGMPVEYSHIDDSCLLMHFDSELAHNINNPTLTRSQVEGFMCIILCKGNMVLEINSDKVEATGPALINALHSDLFHFELRPDTDFDIYMLQLAPEFLQDINISFSAISGETLVSHHSPVFNLQDGELSLLMRYFKLISKVMSDNFNTQLSRHIVANILAAFFYQNVAILYKRLDNSYPNPTGVNRNNYVHEFMKLVHLNYTRERSVSFYANSLFISPKYLSLLVKEATGRSAARWIDFFVINEAKNLLRFSGKNIQQVAYALNFSNQSSFGKYFKHLTGMSPTEYQKS